MTESRNVIQSTSFIVLWSFSAFLLHILVSVPSGLLASFHEQYICSSSAPIQERLLGSNGDVA
eukprot:6469630-Amphidinium_carterae.1